jgi:hypothetical protein
MTEEEANGLIEEVNAEIEDAIRAWGVNGASNRPGSIHQIFTRETEGIAGSGGVQPNATNLSGAVGLAAATVYELRFRETSGAEYAVPAPNFPRRFDSTVNRYAPAPSFGIGGLDFIQDSSGAMRVYVNDPWVTIGGVNAARATNANTLGGGRPYLTIPNNGNQYSIFKKATCSRQVYFPDAGAMPVPDVMSAGFFECDIYQRPGGGEWMPHTTYEYETGTTDPEVYSGDVVYLVSGFTCMGFRNVNIAAEGAPSQVVSCFIISEQDHPDVTPIFSWRPEDDTEYAEKVDLVTPALFDRLVAGAPLTGISSSVSPIFPCP